MHNQIDAQLVVMIDQIRAQREQQYCLDVLDLCNLCGKSLKKERFVIDGEVKGTPQIKLPDGSGVGQWAYMCSSCFSKNGFEIRFGRGQLYEQIAPGRWLQVAGFPIQGDEEL